MIAFLVFVTQLISLVWSHGRIINPPGRSTAWRYGFNTPINYNDNELFCGGFAVQWQQNGGKCGVCGDAWNSKRENELPDGKYAKYLEITGEYEEDSIIQTQVELTANHKGYFIFKLCPATSMQKEVTQACLDQNVLKVWNHEIPTERYVLPHKNRGIFDVYVGLPKGLTCNRCVLQWTYVTGNNWGVCEDGRGALGCGPQENFRGCSDIRIKRKHTRTETLTPTSVTPSVTTDSHVKGGQTEPATPRPTRRTTIQVPTSTEVPFSVKGLTCEAVGPYRAIKKMADWCVENCSRNFCPPSHCVCRTKV